MSGSRGFSGAAASDRGDDGYTVRDARYPPAAGAGGDTRETPTLKTLDANDEARRIATIRNGGESDFKNFILYVKNGDANSHEALRLLNGNVMLKNQTFIQEVSALRVRPPWLNGVPILVDKAKRYVHRGTNALDFLKSYEPHEAVGRLGRRFRKSQRADFATGKPIVNNWTITSSPWDMTGALIPSVSNITSATRGRDDGKISGEDKEVGDYVARYQKITDEAKRYQEAGARGAA